MCVVHMLVHACLRVCGHMGIHIMCVHGEGGSMGMSITLPHYSMKQAPQSNPELPQNLLGD